MFYYVLWMDREMVVAVQSLSHVQIFVTPQTAACQAPLSSTFSWSLLKFTAIESMMLSNHLIFWYLLPFSFSLSQHQGPYH